MSDQVRESLQAWVEEALELRHGEAGDPEGKVGLPPYEAGQSASIAMLQRVRVRLDRIEELQSKARQMKGRVLRTRDEADFEASLAYDQAMQQNRATRIQDYVTAAEKNADASLASFEQKRRAHQIKLLESFSVEALDVITQCYWGLEKLREDILQMIRLLNNNYLTAIENQT